MVPDQKQYFPNHLIEWTKSLDLWVEETRIIHFKGLPGPSLCEGKAIQRQSNWFISVISFSEPDKPKKPNKPDEPTEPHPRHAPRNGFGYVLFLLAT
jgi:hypothetical protein